MTSKRLEQDQTTFDGIRHVGDDGNEYWMARQLAPLLDYPQSRNFLPVLERAREACNNSGQRVADHFADMRKMVDIGCGQQHPPTCIREEKATLKAGRLKPGAAPSTARGRWSKASRLMIQAPPLAA